MKKENFEIYNNGCCIKGRHYIPKQRIGLPVIISHEFGMSMRTTGRYAGHLCGAGYSVYIFDFPGSGAGSSKGRRSQDMTLLTEKDDLSLVMDYVMQKERCGSVILGGCSQGGIVTALLAPERAAEIEKIFLLYPAFSIPDDARKGNMLGSPIDPADPPEEFNVMKFVALGKNYVITSQTLEPWREIRGYAKPVLIIHGTKDKLVDISYSKRAAEEYPNARLVEFKGVNHLFFWPWTVKKAAKAVLDFLAE